jgi:drug/metabolite transporter (DMT)-like permease
MTLSDNARGAAFMSASMAAFVINDAIMKGLIAELPLYQTMFLRGVIATLMIGGVAQWRGVLLSRIAPEDRGMVTVRLLGEIGSTVCFLTALFHLPLANTTAITQVTPLAVTLGAALLLREPVGWRRWIAIAVGFGGVLLIVRPASDGFNVHAVWALGSVAFIVMRDLATRRFSAGLPALFVATTTAAGIAVTGGLLSLTEPWAPVSPSQIGLLCVSSAFLVTGYHSAVQSMRFGEISLVSPFRYTVLIWAIILGFVVFGDVPDPLTLLGAGIVVAAGIFTFYRERIRRRQAAAGR